MRVKKAVIPVAGLGTRFLPATKAIPKEMIPVLDKPMIQFIVEEAVASGIEDVILVTARGKGSIEDHFDYAFELETTLESRGKKNLYETSRKIGDLCNIISIRQKNPMGLGHAVLAAAPAVGNEPFAVLLGDDLIFGEPPCTRQLIDVFEKQNQSVIGVLEVPKAETSKYGIVGGKDLGNNLFQVDHVVEKPKPEAAPSCLAIPGRYVLKPDVFDDLRATKPGAGGEIQLTDALTMQAKKDGLMAYTFEGKRFDTGDRLGMIDATLHYALGRSDLKDSVREIMKSYLSQEGT